MNIFDKLQNISRTSRIIIGIVTITIGYLLNDDAFSWSWWYLGIIPLFIGLTNLCPLCSLTNKCSIGSKKWVQFHTKMLV
jgi:hypothetical protein